MEVVSLNQYAIKDKEITNDLENINVQVKDRMKSKSVIQWINLIKILKSMARRNY